MLCAYIVSVSEPFALDFHEQEGEDGRHHLGRDDRKPEPVYAEQHRQQKDGAEFKDERAQKRNDRRGDPVVQRRKEARAEDRKTDKEEGQTEDAEAGFGERHQLGVVADKQLRKWPCKPFGRADHQYAADQQQGQALFQQAFEFVAVLRAEMETDDRRGADRVADEDRSKDHVDVHHHAVRCHTILAGICHQLHIHDHADNAHRRAADQFRYTV